MDISGRIFEVNISKSGTCLSLIYVDDYTNFQNDDTYVFFFFNLDGNFADFHKTKVKFK